MAERRYLFLVVLLMSLSGSIWSQSLALPAGRATVISILIKPRPFVSKFGVSPVFGYNDCTAKSPFRLINAPTSGFYPNSLGVICKTELKMDKITPVPLRFRLGSLDYVNWMERKPNAIKPQ